MLCINALQIELSGSVILCQHFTEVQEFFEHSLVEINIDIAATHVKTIVK